MSIYIGNDLEDRLKILEMENASLKRYNEYHQLVHEIDHLSDLSPGQTSTTFHTTSYNFDVA